MSDVPIQCSSNRRRALLLGHFSTVGDIQCLDLVERRVRQAGMPYDVAAFESEVRSAIKGSIKPEIADPDSYSHLVIICGPYWESFLAHRAFDIARYRHCKRIGINITMIDPLAQWKPFDVLLERDSEVTARPDLTFLVETDSVPVVGRCIIRQQEEYGVRQRHSAVISSIDSIIERRGYPVIDIDTRWPKQCNDGGLGSPAAVSSLIKRVDVLITNRLHGLVFALRNGVPALAVDSVAGGDKLTTQARVIGWPVCLQAEQATPEAMDAALDWCLGDAANNTIRRCQKKALKLLWNIEAEIDDALGNVKKRRSASAGKSINAVLQRARAVLLERGGSRSR